MIPQLSFSPSPTGSPPDSIRFEESVRGENLPSTRPFSKNVWTGVSTGAPDLWPQQERRQPRNILKATFDPVVSADSLGEYIAPRRGRASEYCRSPGYFSSRSGSEVLSGTLKRLNTWPQLTARTGCLDYLEDTDDELQGDNRSEGSMRVESTARKSRRMSVKSNTFAMGQKSKSFEHLKSRGGDSSSRTFWKDLKVRLGRFSIRRSLSSASVISKVSKASTAVVSVASSLNEFFKGIFMWNSSMVDLFASEGNPVGVLGNCGIFCSIFVVYAGLVVAFSDAFGLCFDIYLGLVQLDDWALPLLSVAALGVALLHVFDVYDWPCSFGMKCSLVVPPLFIAFVGVLCMSKNAPEIPLIIGCLQIPVIIFVLRLASIGRWGSLFFSVAVNRCLALLSLLSFTLWVSLVTASGPGWGKQTEHRLLFDMAAILEEYGLQTWSQCEVAQRDENPDEAIVASCAHVEVIAFLAWMCPVLVGGFLLTISLFFSMRVWHLKRTSEQGEDANVQRVIFFVVLLVCCIVVTFTVVVTSIGLSNVLFPVLGGGLVVCAVWLVSSVRLQDLARQITTSLIWQILSPIVVSNWARAFVFFFFNIFVFAFFALEFLTRSIQRLRRKSAPSMWTTSRGSWLVKVLSDWNWALVLEKAWLLSSICVIFLVIAARISLVFMSFLNEYLETLPLWQVFLLFYCIGLALCLLPFVPVVPIYMSAGIVIVARMKDENGFWSGVVVASLIGLAMKLVASAIQQKVIGGWLAKSTWVQRRVGVHTVPTRAVEMALKTPGFSATKIAILCGGPDWITFVLVGILRLDTLPIIVATLPVIFLIFPTVLAGACLLEETLQKASPIVLLGMTIANGSVCMLALILILKVATENSAVLQESRKSHRELEEQANIAAARQRDLWLLSRQPFKILEQWCLMVAVALQFGCFWVIFIIPTSCFRTFNLHSKVSDSFKNDGLESDFFNLFLPAGRIVCLVSLSSAVFFIFHMRVVKRSPKDSESQETMPTHSRGSILRFFTKAATHLSTIDEETRSQAASKSTLSLGTRASMNAVSSRGQSSSTSGAILSSASTSAIGSANSNSSPTPSELGDSPVPPNVDNAAVPMPLRVVGSGSAAVPSLHKQRSGEIAILHKQRSGLQLEAVQEEKT